MKKYRPANGRFLFLCVLISACLCQVMVFPAAGTPVSEAEREKQEAEEKFEAASQAADELEQKKQDTDSEAGRVDGQLTELLRDISLLESDMEALEEQIKLEQKKYDQAEDRRELQYNILKKRIQYVYEQGDITYLDIFLKAKSIGDAIVGTEYFRQLYEYDRNLIEKYEQVKDEVLIRKERLELWQSELKTMKQEDSLREKELRAMLEDKKKESVHFQQQLQEARTEAKRQADEVKRQSKRISLLRKKEEQERELERQRLLAARQQQAGAAQNTGGAAAGPGAADSVGRGSKSVGGSEFGRSVADYALQFVGNPYVWGGTSLTSGADCSGFVQSVYRNFGVSIPRTSGEQAKYGKEIAYQDMEPGDLICYPGHVAMYIGDGRIVHASSAKAGIRVDYDPAYRTIVSIRRPS